MGLDSVTIVMEVEDHFGFTLKTSEAESVRSVGDLVRLIRNRIIAAGKLHCPTFSAFISLRSVVREVVGDDRFHLRPRMAIEATLTVAQRQALWQMLAQRFDLPPSPLRRPPALRRALVALASLSLALALGAALMVDVATLPLTLLGSLFPILLAHLGTLRFRQIPPDGWETFGDISRRIVGVEVATKRLHLCDTDAVLNELRPIIVDVLGVQPTDVTLDARFIEDLGLD